MFRPFKDLDISDISDIGIELEPMDMFHIGRFSDIGDLVHVNLFYMNKLYRYIKVS